MSAEKKPGGLAGIVAGQTTICTVGKEGVGLTYRGYSIEELASQATFEESRLTCWFTGICRTGLELEAYRKKLISLRGLPVPLSNSPSKICRATMNPMDVLRTGCSTLGCLEPEGAGRDQF